MASEVGRKPGVLKTGVLKQKKRSGSEFLGVMPWPAWPGFKGLEKGPTRKLIH